MSRWKRFVSRASVFGCRTKWESELDREMRDHLELDAEEQEQKGLAPEEARYAAQRAFGNTSVIKDDVREVWMWSSLDRFFQDLRYAFRGLSRNSGFTWVALLTLALGIGANTAVFSVVYSVLFRPLPYKDSDRIVRIIQNESTQSARDDIPQRLAAISTDDLQQWRTQTKTFSHMAAYFSMQLVLHEGEQSTPIRAAIVSPSMFPLLGAAPWLGRAFESDEEEQGRNSVVILSYSAWQKYLGGKPDVLNRTLNLGGTAYTIVGVMPAGLEFPDRETEFWLPLVLSPIAPTERVRGIALVQTIARLAEGVPIEVATSEANALFLRFRQEEKGSAGGIGQARSVGPHSHSPSQAEDGIHIELVGLKDELVGPVRPALIVLLVAVAFVLLIACANVANLLLARAVRRQTEFAIRAALGAGRVRLIRQVMTESITLALLGGIAGTVFAIGGVRLFATIGARYVPRVEEIRIDLPVFAFTFALSILTGIVFGFIPALRLPRSNHTRAIQRGVAATSSGSDLFGRNRTRSLLAVGEIALAMILLTGAGLLINSFLKLSNVDWGYRPENLLTFRIDFDQTRYRGFEAQKLLYEQVITRLELLPGVRSAAVTSSMPILKGAAWVGMPLYFEGRPKPTKPEEFVSADVRIVSRSYVGAMAMRIAQGRDFEDRDRTGQPSVMLVNRAMARSYFQRETPVGKRVRFFENGPGVEIVGILDDVRYAGLDRDPGPEIYLDIEQAPGLMPSPPSPPGAHVGSPAVTSGFGRGMRMAVRTVNDPMNMVAGIRGVVGQMDSQLVVDNIATMEQGLDVYVARPRFYAVLLGILSTIAVALAAIGIYGLVAYSVSQRTREIGIRIAIGAERREVLWLVLRQGLVLTAIGIIMGILGALQLTHYLKSMLFGLTATDTFTFLIVAIVIAVVATFACYIPSRRATKVDPVIALRYE